MYAVLLDLLVVGGSCVAYSGFLAVLDIFPRLSHTVLQACCFRTALSVANVLFSNTLWLWLWATVVLGLALLGRVLLLHVPS